MKYFDLNDGNRIPAIGFGTYLLNGFHGVMAMRAALNNGYRLLDSAVNYENEGAVGRAVHTSGVDRNQVFITSKLPGRHQSYDQAITQIQDSLCAANLDYFDLYLIHWPNPKEDKYVEAWRALIDAQKFGLVHSIGVSNFLPEHIDRLIKETGVTPAVNQVELHPYGSNKEIREYDKAHHIVTEAWSPLGRGGAFLKEQVIKDLAEKYGKSPVQVVLRWEDQLGIVPIPKASSYAHQISNLNIFDFKMTQEELDSITALDKADGLRFDPRTHEEF